MTGNNGKLRAVFLAALMVLSVFAGTVAFTGSAAAQEYAGGAVHYDNSSTANWTIEVPIDGAISSTDQINSSNITVLDDDDPVSGAVNFTASQSESTVNTIRLNMTQEYASNDLEVELSGSFADTLQGTYSVAYAAESFDNDSLTSNETVYQGTTVAVYNVSGEGPFPDGHVFYVVVENRDLCHSNYNGG